MRYLLKFSMHNNFKKRGKLCVKKKLEKMNDKKCMRKSSNIVKNENKN